MNNKIFISLLLFAALVTSVSCEKPEKEKTGNPEVKIEVLSCSTSSVTFSITPSGADRCAYIVLPSSDPAPEASAVLEQGTSVNPSEKSENTVDNLTQQTEYRIYAASAAEEILSSVAQASFTTDETPRPSAAVTVVEVDYQSVKFTIEPVNALKCAYVIVKDGEEIPSAEDILADGTEADASALSTHREEDLSEDTGYTIAAAVSGESENTVITGTFRTEQSPYDIDITALHLDGEFYGDWLDFGNDNFLIILSDVGFNEEGDENPGGRFITIDLYSPIAEDQDNPAPAVGEYPANSSDEEFSINCGYSYYYTTDQSGASSGKVYLEGGVMNISKKDHIYTLTAEFTLEDGQVLHCEYEGPFVLPEYEDNSKLPILENSVSTTFTGASVTNYGNDFGAYNLVILLWDMNENEAGNPVAPGNLLKLDVMTDLADGNLTPGEYVLDVDGTNAPFTYLEGSIMEFYGIQIPVGTYLQHYNEEGETDGYGFVNGGSVNVSKSGDEYTLDIKVTLNGAYTLEATYTGKLNIAESQQSTAAASKAVNTTDKLRACRDYSK